MTLQKIYQGLHELSAFKRAEFAEEVKRVENEISQNQLKEKEAISLLRKLLLTYYCAEDLIKEDEATVGDLLSTLVPANSFLPQTPLIKKVEFASSIELPYIPAPIDAKDFQENGLLLTDEQVNEVQKLHKENIQDPKISKKNKRLKLNPSFASLFLHDDVPYIVHKTYGKGASGKVKLIQNTKTQKLEVVKEIVLPEKDEEAKAVINKEEKYLHQLGLSNGLVYRKIAGKKSKAYVGMKLVRGIQLTQLDFKLPINRCVNLFKAMSLSVQELHNKQLLHCDIKRANMVYDPVAEAVTLIDLGKSEQLNENEEFIEKKLCGTYGFLAPELLVASKQAKVKYTKKTDTFALGKTIQIIWEKYKSHMKISNSYLLPESFIQEIDNLIAKMTADNPKDRPDIRDIIEFFEKIQEECLAALTNLRQIGVVNIEELFDQKGNLQTTLIKPLKQFDQVWVIDPQRKYNLSNSKTQLDIGCKLSQLISCGIPVTSHIIQPNEESHDTADVVDALPFYLETIENKNNPRSINSYSYVTAVASKHTFQNIALMSVRTNKTVTDYWREIRLNPIRINDKQFKLLLEDLRKELDRLRIKAKDPKNSQYSQTTLEKRIGKIVEAIELISNSYETGNLSHGETYHLLSKLQSEMIHTTRIFNFFNFFFRTKSAKTIAVLKEKIKPEMPAASAEEDRAALPNTGR